MQSDNEYDDDNDNDDEDFAYEEDEDDSRQSFFEMLNNWIHGKPEMLTEAFENGELSSTGSADRQLYRVIIAENIHKLSVDGLESWSKSKQAAMQFLKKEHAGFAEGKKIILLCKEILSSEQIIDLSETDVDDVYPEEEEVICKSQDLNDSHIVATFRFEGGEAVPID